MTIIVYKDGIMAADTLVTDDSMRAGYYEKIRRLTDGTLAGASGRLSDAEAFLNWADRGIYSGVDSGVPRMPFMTDDRRFEGLVVLPHTTPLIYDYTGRGAPLTAPFITLGSGGFIAAGILHCEGSITQAVKTAIALDVYCGGVIQVLYRDKHTPTT